jgi:hypothetical protein
MGLMDAWYGTSKNFHRIMAEAQTRHGGNYDKAAKEVIDTLAQLEADREAALAAAAAPDRT